MLSDRKLLRKGDRVRVTPLKPNGEPHPHAGKTGIVLELMGVYTTLFNPQAQVKIDAGFKDTGNVMIVSLVCLEKI